MNIQIIHFQETQEVKEQKTSLRNMVVLMAKWISNMEKKYDQLKTISQEHFDVYIRMQAEDFLKKQSNVLKIGYELLARITESLENAKNRIGIQKELVQQFFDELDILNLINFEVTKTYFSFLHHHQDIAKTNQRRNQDFSYSLEERECLSC